jgi:hypothetical protein
MKGFRLKLSESILLSFVIIGGALLFQRFWVIPNSQRLVEMQEKTKVIRAKIEELKTQLNTVAVKIPVNEEVKTAQSLLDRYISTNDKFSSVIMGIFSGSKEREFNISKIIAERSEKVGVYTQTLYQIEAESSFIAIGKFLEGLEDSALLTEVESINISKIEDEMKRCKASIRLFGYVGGGAP